MIGQLDSDYLQYGKRFSLRRLAIHLLFEGWHHTSWRQRLNPFINGFPRLLTAFPREVSTYCPTYITCMGRSGTTIPGKVLFLHEDIEFLNEPKMMRAIADTRTDICGHCYNSNALRHAFNRKGAWTDLSNQIG